VLDTGTFLIYGPRYVVEEYFSMLGNNCRHKELLPDIVFSFSQGETIIDIVLTPEDYVI